MLPDITNNHTTVIERAASEQAWDLRPSLWPFKDATYWKRVCHFLLLPGMACPGIESPSLVRAASAYRRDKQG